MIQEYIAFGAFITAVFIAAASILKFFITQVKSRGNDQCSASCNCKPQDAKSLAAKPLRIGNHHNFRHHKLK